MTDLPRAVGIFSNYPNTPSLEDKTSYTLEDSANPSTHTDGDYRKVKRTWYGVIWDTWDLPKPERRLLFKVDAVLLTFASVRTIYHYLEVSKVIPLLIVLFYSWVTSSRNGLFSPSTGLTTF